MSISSRFVLSRFLDYIRYSLTLTFNTFLILSYLVISYINLSVFISATFINIFLFFFLMSYTQRPYIIFDITTIL